MTLIIMLLFTLILTLIAYRKAPGLPLEGLKGRGQAFSGNFSGHGGCLHCSGNDRSSSPPGDVNPMAGRGIRPERSYYSHP